MRGRSNFINLDPNSHRHKLLKVTFQAYIWPFVSAIPPPIPFLISATLNFITAPSTPENNLRGSPLVGAYVLTYMGLATSFLDFTVYENSWVNQISTAVYWRQTFRFNTTVRAGLISLVYRQTTKMHAAEFKSRSAITLMGTDVERIVQKFRNIHEIWVTPVEAVIAIFLLERQLGVVCLIPAGISIIAVIGTIPVSTKSNVAQKIWIEHVQTRLSVTSEMLNDMKAVKMLGLREKLFKAVSLLRTAELKASQRFRVLLIWMVALSNLPLALAPFATFTIFAIVQSVRGGETLLADRVFTSLSLISLMTEPLLNFIQTLPQLYQSLSSFDRIEEYCVQAPFDAPAERSLTQADIELSSIHAPPLDSVLEFRGASFSWSQISNPILHDMNLSIKKGTITAIIGPVGSGKSTLLESAIGETICKSGSVSYFQSMVAYCSQTPWIINDTIRQNITGVATFDAKWYNFVVWACALENDFQNIPGGDMSKAGSSGITLSGGQKQRISLARAVYSRASTLVLDDVFSGLDNKSVAAISYRLLAADGHFRESGRTVVLVTHNHRLLPFADEIVLLDGGKITLTGTYDQIRSTLPEEKHNHVHESSSDDETPFIEKNVASTTISRIVSATEADSINANNTRRQGKWSVYAYYFESSGRTLIAFLVASIAIASFVDKYSTVWLQQWSDYNVKHPSQKLGLYIGVYAVLVSIGVFCLLSTCWIVLVRVINNTGLRMHANLLKTTLRCWFDDEPDLELIDMNLPLDAINTSMSFANCVVQLIILCIMGKYLTVTVPVLAVVLFLVQNYYLRTSRQVRLLDIEAKSPLFTHFVETMQGISVIRAMRWQRPFEERLQELLNQSQKPFYMLYCIQQWLQLVLDCIVMALAVVLVTLVISLKDQFSAGAIGVALNLILSFNQDLMILIKFWTSLETSIGAVSRIQEFVANTPPEDQGQDLLGPPPVQWPSGGEIVFKDVNATYNPTSAPVLTNLSLTIHSGEKVAICGPSGSGKTSFILGLLQMIEVQNGSITIDDVDLSTLSCGTVRFHVNVVPQDPFFMPGTLRFNLDRDSEHNPAPDACLIQALEIVDLWKKVCGTSSGRGELDQELSLSDWSMGERQLLALARAVVTKSSILILDEATSSVDWDTEAIMQNIIEKDFASQTVISVMHRLRYIERFDRVALLKHGRLVEFDTPQALLARPSEFRSFYHAKQME
ncbi:hypothetical protein N7448_004367 [Penicillium atrosanguineum]|nr:hypothetical protein N7448_004367 [Penicillium atrosanguineum]